MTDGTTLLSLDLDPKPAIQSLKGLRKSVEGVMKGLKSDISTLEKEISSVQKQMNDIVTGKKKSGALKNLEKEFEASQKQLKTLRDELNNLLSGQVKAKSVIGLESEITKTDKRIAELREKLDSFAQGNTKPKSLTQAEKAANALEKQLASVVKQVEKLGVVAADPSLDGLYKQSGMTRVGGYVYKQGSNAEVDKVMQKYATLLGSAKSARLQANWMGENPDLVPEIKQAQDELVTAQLEAEKLRKKLAKLQTNPAATQEATALEAEIQKVVSQMNILQQKMDAIRGNPEATQEYQELNKQLQDLLAQLSALQEEGEAGAQALTSIALLRKPIEFIGKSIKKIGQSLKNLAKRAIYMTFILTAMRSLRTYLSDMVKLSPKLQASLNKLTGNFQMAFQTLFSAVEPILIKIIDWIAKAFAYLAAFIGYVTKTSVSDAKKTVQAVGKASKQLASFDELNILSDSNSNAITPDPEEIEMTEKLKETFDKILEVIKLIGIALGTLGLFKLLSALAKVSEILGPLQGTLGTGLKNLAGIILIIVGAIMLINGYLDAWNNGINLDNLTQSFAGLALVVAGMALLFGPVAAGITAVIGGIALLVLGIKDMIDNGINANNMLMVIIATVTIIIGLVMTTHVILAAIIAVIAAVIAIAGICGGEADNMLQHIRDAIENIKKAIEAFKSGDMEAFKKYLKDFGKSILNFFIDIFEGLVHALGKAINAIGVAVSKIGFGPVPDWVPIIGGKSWKFTSAANWGLGLQSYKVPRLAQGAVIPPNSQFLAMLGDQTSGTNIEAPLDTMVDAFTKASNSSGVIDALNTLIRIVEKKNLSISASDIRKAVNTSSMRVGV